LLIVGMNWSAISLIVGTDAYFNDTEVSGNNILTTGALDFELAGDSFAPEVNLGQDATKTISVLDTDSTMDYSYKVKVENSLGGLCPYLFLEDNVSGASQQPLNNFVSGEVLHSDITSWTFTASLNNSTSSDWENKECVFDLVYEGRQKNYDEGSFSDIERISNTITAAGGNQQGIELSDVVVNPLQSEYCGTCQGSNNSSNLYCALGLYYKQQLNIAWKVTNLVANTDLLFDIIYITDNDCSGDISNGDEQFVVVRGKSITPVSPGNYAYIWTGWVNNDDLRKWNTNNGQWWRYHKDNGSTDDVPYFYGYAWIKIIATEQGNSTTSDSDTSVAMFEPLPPGLSLDNVQSILEESLSHDEHCPAAGLENCLEENFKADGFVKSVPIPSQKGSGGGGGGTQGGDDEDEMGILGNEDTGENSGDGGDSDSNDGRSSDSNVATDTTTDATNDVDDKEPAVTDLSSREDDSAADDDSGLSVTNNLDESGTVDDDGEEEGIDLPLPITNNSDGGDNGGGEESAPDSFDDDSARVSEII